MSIVNSTYVSSPIGTKNHIREVHTDHLGNVYTKFWIADQSIDVSVIVASHADELNERIADAEVTLLIGDQP